MTRVAYTVTATLPDSTTASDYIGWLQGGHTDAVIAGGASSAAVLLLDAEPGSTGPVQVEVRYTFPSREAYDRYVERHAPALREDGLKRFGSVPGITFSRRTGTIV